MVWHLLNVLDTAWFCTYDVDFFSLIHVLKFLLFGFSNDFFKDFIYLFVREIERTQAGGVAGRGRSRLPAEQGVRCGT